MRPFLPALIVVLTLAGCGITTVETGGTLDGAGYTIEIADEWADTTEDAASIGDLGIDDPAVEQITIDAVVSATDADGDFAPNLTIVITPAGGETDPVRLANVNLKTAIQAGALPPGAGGGSISFDDSSVEEIELGGEPAAYYEQVADSPVGEARQRQIYAIRDDTAYALTYGGLENRQFDEYLPALEEMLGSWQWDSG
ncbi:MAG: hypothetical protein ACR2OC_02000 [Solirubrobacterales bacterium]